MSASGRPPTKAAPPVAENHAVARNQESPECREHLDRVVRLWLGVAAPANVEIPRLPQPLVRLLLRAEEYEHSRRDQWDCWEHSFSDNYRAGSLWHPELDVWVAATCDVIGTETALEPRWPDDRPFAVCLTHDVDIISTRLAPAQALRAVRAAVRDTADCRGRERLAPLVAPFARVARWGVSRHAQATFLERCVGIEHEYGVPASYFFPVYRARGATIHDCAYALEDSVTFRGRRQPVADVARALAEEGFDIGLHGSYRSAVEAGALAEEKHALESATQARISTTRQHYLHWHPAATPRLQEAAGIGADSTLGFNRNIGFRAGTSLPFRWFSLAENSSVDVLEVPLIVQDGAVTRPNALELDRELGASVVRELLDRIRAVGGLATVLFHPHTLAEDSVLFLFRYVIEYGLKHGAWFASVADVHRHWDEREQRLLR